MKINLVYLGLLFLILPTAPVSAQTESPLFRFDRTVTSQTAVINRPKTYDTSPSVIQEGDIVKAWYCSGGDRNTTYFGHDSVFYTSYNVVTGQIITPPTRVIAPALNDTAEDGDMACAVTVVKHQNPYIPNFQGQLGAPQYKMWYECAPRVYRLTDGGLQGCFTQICHAASDDGIHWKKFEWIDSQTGSWRFVDPPGNPSAILQINDTIKNNIQLQSISGKRFAYYGSNPSSGCNDLALNYGVGHPSAITLQPQTDGFQRIQLWYYDSQGVWNNRAEFMTESWDGFHFDTVRRTDIQSPNRIKLVNVPLLGHSYFYLASSGPFYLNIFNYSWDGLDWSWSDQGYPEFYTGYLAANYQIGSATGCVTGGNSFFGDQYGWIHSLTNLSFLSTEGGFGPYDSVFPGQTCYSPEEDPAYTYPDGTGDHGARGSSWGLWSLQGNLTFIAPPPNPFDLNYDNFVDYRDFLLLLPQLQSNPDIFRYNQFLSAFGH